MSFLITKNGRAAISCRLLLESFWREPLTLIQQLGLIWHAVRIADSRTVSGKNHSRLMGVPNLSSFRTPEFQADAGELEFTP
jgi:hypothetical protein